MSAVYYLRHRKVKPFPNFDDKPEKSEVVKLQPKRRKRRIRSITRAKTLTEEQFLVCVAEARKRPHPERNIAILHLSFYAGLRAQEIAGLRWKRNILGADHKIADNLHVTRDIGKRTQERYIPIRATPLRKALQDLLDLEGTRGVYVIQPLYERSNHSERASEEPRKVHPNTLAQWCSRFFDLVGYNGCTSHSGRRTFITGLARRCNLEQSSILDVQKLAGHANITTTMSYIEESPHRDKLVERVFQ